MIAGGVLSASINTANFFWLFSCCKLGSPERYSKRF
jgi:hypothetical protein